MLGKILTLTNRPEINFLRSTSAYNGPSNLTGYEAFLKKNMTSYEIKGMLMEHGLPIIEEKYSRDVFYFYYGPNNEQNFGLRINQPC